MSKINRYILMAVILILSINLFSCSPGSEEGTSSSSTTTAPFSTTVYSIDFDLRDMLGFTNGTITADDIVAFIQKKTPNSPMLVEVDIGSSIINNGLDNSVNPAFLIATAYLEGNFGTGGWAASHPESHNTMGWGIPGPNTPPDDINSADSWGDLIDRVARSIAYGNYYYTQGRYTVDQVRQEYAAEANSPSIASIMNELYSFAIENLSLPPPEGITQVAGFSVAVTSIAREENATTLYFVMTKVANTATDIQSLSVVLVDDHGNEYSGIFYVDVNGASDFVLDNLPIGFSYVDSLEISIPLIAFIDKLRLDNREIAYDRITYEKPQFMVNFSNLATTMDQGVQVGKWLTFTMKQALPDLPNWYLPILVENEEYNPLPAKVRLGVQNDDGTISWGDLETEEVSGQSQTTVWPSFNPKETPPHPRLFILEYSDQKNQEYSLRMFSMPPGKLLPFTVNSQIYEKWREGYFSLGFPTGDEQLVTSGAQGFSTKGYVQHFEWGTIYYITSGENAGQVFDIRIPIESFYEIEMQGPASWLGFPVMQYASPETGYDQCDFEGGYLATSDGRSFRAFPYEKGKITFVSDRDGNREIYISDTSGRNQVNLTRHPSSDISPAWSPDGARIVFVSDRSPQGIYIMNADGTGLMFLAEGIDPSWFPDGSKIIFVRKVGSYYALFMMNSDGTGQQQVPLDPSTFVKWGWGQTSGRQFRHPTVSPDGTTIAFAAGQWESGHAYNVYTVKLDGTSLVNVSEIKEYGYGGDNPSWSPDGKLLAFRGDSGYFITGYSHGGRLYIKEFGAVPQVNLPSNIWSYGGLDWSPDGSAIAFSGYKKDVGIDIYVTNVSTNVVRRITDGEGNNWDPSWIASL